MVTLEDIKKKSTFLFTSNGLSKRKVNRTVPFIIAAENKTLRNKCSATEQQGH